MYSETGPCRNGAIDYIGHTYSSDSQLYEPTYILWSTFLVLTSPDTQSLTEWIHSSDKVNDATVGLRVNEFTITGDLGKSLCCHYATTNSLTKSYEVYWVTNCWYLLDTVHWNRSVTYHDLQVSRKWSSKSWSSPVQSPESRFYSNPLGRVCVDRRPKKLLTLSHYRYMWNLGLCTCSHTHELPILCRQLTKL